MWVGVLWWTINYETHVTRSESTKIARLIEKIKLIVSVNHNYIYLVHGINRRQNINAFILAPPRHLGLNSDIYKGLWLPNVVFCISGLYAEWFVSILALTTGNPVYLISTKAHGGCDRSAEDAYSSMALDPTFAFVGGPCCFKLNFLFALWIMITFYTLLTPIFCNVGGRDWSVIVFATFLFL
jgi:hypothetical protein